MSEHEYKTQAIVEITIPYTVIEAGSRMNERPDGQAYINLGKIDFDGCKTLKELGDKIIGKDQDTLREEAWEAYFEELR